MAGSAKRPEHPRTPRGKSEYWNHNTAYYPLVVDALPTGATAALDIGCGDGELARRLRAAGCPRVVGIDRSPEMIARARERSGGESGITFTEGDFLDLPLPRSHFDLVSFVASLHHMDQAAALPRAASLLRPGGRIAVVGLSGNATAADWIISGLKLPIVRLNDLIRSNLGAPPGMPVRGPATGYGQIRREAREALPGAQLRRLLYYRYSLLWTKPERDWAVESAPTGGCACRRRASVISPAGPPPPRHRAAAEM